MTARLRLIPGSRGVPTTVVVRQTVLDDLADEVAALDAEAQQLVDRALPLARRCLLMADATGPAAGRAAHDLVALLERHRRQHSPEKAA